jgi:RNA polymerase sigma-70 factor (ECF subfamily)
VTKPVSTQSRLEHAGAGESSAFDELFVRFGPRLLVLAHALNGERLRGHAECEDVLQEVYVRALRSLPQFEPRRSGEFYRWLAQICRHAVVDLRRWLDARAAAGAQRSRSTASEAQPESIPRSGTRHALSRPSSRSANRFSR